MTKRRPFAAAAVVVALAAGLMAATPGLAGFKSGTYTGTTSQNDEGGFPHDLMLKVNRAKTKVNVVFFEFEADPCKGIGGLQYAGLTARIKRSGRFEALSPADGFYGYVKGQFQGGNASGTALYHYDASGCNSGVVNWTAAK